MGYCGADLRSLCAEAALFALRRRYPQIYNTTEKLLLDVSKINVTATDFHNALKAIVPTAQRSDTASALSLPEHVQPLLLQSLQSILNLISFIFPPAWDLVCRAACELKCFLDHEVDAIAMIENRIQELKASPSSQRRSQSVDAKNGRLGNGHMSQYDDESPLEGPRLRNRVASTRRSNSYISVFDKARNMYSTVGNWSGDATSVTKNHSIVNNRLLSRSATSKKAKRGRNDKHSPSAYAQLFEKHDHPDNLRNIFFDLTELSYDQSQSGDEGCHHASILEARNSMSPAPVSTQYLTVSSHPHAPPAVHQPRLILCGPRGMGQSLYLGPAVLRALEDLPVQTMDLASLFGISTKSPEEACTQVSTVYCMNRHEIFLLTK